MAVPARLWQRATQQPLVVALAISLLLHVGGYGTWRLFGQSLFSASKGVLSSLIAKLAHSERKEKKLIDDLKQRKNQEVFEDLLRQQKEIPLSFVEVDPALASLQPPKNAQHYSTHDTLASNPKPLKNTLKPKIEGVQTKVPRLFDNPIPQPKPVPQPLQPFVPPKEIAPPSTPLASSTPKETQSPQLRADARPDAKSEPAKPLENVAPKTFEKAEAKPDLKPPGGEVLGELAKAEPRKTVQPNKLPGAGAPVAANPLITDPSPPPLQHSRPRTLAQAYAQNPQLAGKVIQQEGGVQRPGRISVDAKGSLFGAYDAAFIAAVEQRWYQLIDSYHAKGGVLHQGKVVLDFQLRFDGRITGMSVADKSVEEIQALMCERAVLDPAPFARWPNDMRRMIGGDSREVRFTFYYE